MIIWQRCWINKEYNEVKLKKISFNLPLSWWGYKRPWRTEDPRSKTPQWILWSSWSSKHGASRERTHPRAAAETSSRSAEGNLLIRTKIIVKGSYRQKVCTSHPAVLSLFTSRSWWLASLKVCGGDLNIHLNPKQTAPTKQPVQKWKSWWRTWVWLVLPIPHSSYIRIDQRRDRSRAIESDVGTVDLSECALINIVVD